MPTAPLRIKLLFVHAVAALALTASTALAVTSVTLPGSFQSELGCPGDWDPACANTHLTYDSDLGKWVGTFAVPVGNWEYKVAIDDSWNENYGIGGSPGGANYGLNLATPQNVTFVYDPVSHIVTNDADIPQPNSVTLAGSFQAQQGCPGDWDPACANTHLTYDGGLVKWVGTFNLYVGTWEYKVAINDSWNENYGVGGAPNGNNYVISLPADQAVTFTYDPVTHVVTHDVTLSPVVVAAGSFQGEAGCPGDWMPDCLTTQLALVSAPNGVGRPAANASYAYTIPTLPPGDYEFKIAIGGSWNENYGDGGVFNGNNIPFTVPKSGAVVTFHYDSQTHVPGVIVDTSTPTTKRTWGQVKTLYR
jgi:hypothetical protein